MGVRVLSPDNLGADLKTRPDRDCQDAILSFRLGNGTIAANRVHLIKRLGCSPFFGPLEMGVR
jgi:hypothetical protein